MLFTFRSAGLFPHLVKLLFSSLQKREDKMF